MHTSLIPNCESTPPPPVVINRNLKFEIERVLDSKLDHQKKNPLMYYVQWAGYKGSSKKYFWVPVVDLKNAKKLIAEFH